MDLWVVEALLLAACGQMHTVMNKAGVFISAAVDSNDDHWYGVWQEQDG